MSEPRRSARLGPAFDLLAAYRAPGGFFFERDGLGVAASATGEVVEAPDVAELSSAVLERLSPTSGDGSPPWVALGTLPFAEGPVSMTIPERVVRRTEDGETWRLERGAADRADSRVVGSLPHEVFLPAQLSEHPPVDEYRTAVATAVELIRAGTLDKVVLARTLEVEAGRPLDPARLLHRLRAVEPQGYTFAAPTGRGVMVGASPELLVSLRGGRVRARPLAGTAPRSGDPEEDRAFADALTASHKNRSEHAFVVEAVAAALDPLCDDLTHDPEPVRFETANVWHLATRFDGTARPGVNALDLVAALHPTPAVAGTPLDAALAAIAGLERFDRGRYAGPVGWIDASGDGEFAIALRCAELVGERATLYSGAGIVAESVPTDEADETERKFRAFLDSLRWG